METLLFIERREKEVWNGDGRMQAVAPLWGRADLLCWEKPPPPAPPSTLLYPPPPICFFSSFLLETFTRFFHPHACLPAACEVKWKRNRGGGFQTRIPSGRDGYEAAGRKVCVFVCVCRGWGGWWCVVVAAELHRAVNNKIGEEYHKIWCEIWPK